MLAASMSEVSAIHAHQSGAALSAIAPSITTACAIALPEPVRCGCRKGLSPGRVAGYGATTDETDDSPSPLRNRHAHTPTIAGRIAHRPCSETAIGIARASTGMPTSRIGTSRPTRSETPRTPLAMCIHTAVES